MEIIFTPVGDENYDDYVNAGNFTAYKLNNGNYLSRTMTRTDNYQVNFTAQYARDFGLHHIQGLFSIEKSEAESEYLLGKREAPTSLLQVSIIRQLAR